MNRLTSYFDAPLVYGEESPEFIDHRDPKPGPKWDDRPRLKERKLSATERQWRAAAWYRRHPITFAASCAFCWPPMPLE